MTGKPGLDTAYGLETPDDSRQLYAEWADTYDADFADRMGYVLPVQVARVFIEAGGVGPALDIGAGTGLVAENLPPDTIEIDALDISAEMLARAAAKGRYRSTVVADLSRTLPLPGASYRGLLSAGTFTHGHVGPEALDELLRVAVPEALFVLAINAAHFEALGFATKFDSLKHRIEDLQLERVSIYGTDASGDHADDEALLAIFRKS